MKSEISNVKISRHCHRGQPGHRPGHRDPPCARFSALVLVARSRANLEETAEAVQGAGAETLVIDTDLAKAEAPQMVVDQARANLQPRRRAPQHRRRVAADRPVSLSPRAKVPEDKHQ